MMAVGFTCVDLSEAGHLVAEMAREDDASIAFYFFLKGKLGPRSQTDSYVQVIERCKAAAPNWLRESGPRCRVF